MKKYGLSRYEEIIKFYTNENIYENFKLSENQRYLILDETGLNIDESLDFDVFVNSRVIDILCNSLDKVEVILECKNCDLRYVRFTFEEISYYKEFPSWKYSNLESDLLASVDFIELKKGFRIEFRKRSKKQKSKKQFGFFEIEASYLIIEGLDSDVFSKIELNKSVDQSTEKYKIEYVNKLIKNLNITEEKADELFKIMHNEDFDYYADTLSIFTYYSKSLTDNRGYLDKSRLAILDISKDFKFLVKNLDLCGSDILSFGKTFYDDEFYIVFKLNSYNCYRCYEKEDFYFDENGVFRLKDGVFLIKFIDLLSFKGTYLKLEPYFEFLNVILHDDSSYEFRIGDDHANFMRIRSRDILVKALKKGTRADMYAKRFL